METVLGLSMTSNSVGWVLLDGPGPDAATLDHDVFDVSVGSVDDGVVSRYVTAVQGVQAIAATSGHELKSIGLTWTADAAVVANLLLASLPDLGFEKVVSVRLSEAATRWAQVFGPVLGFEKAAVCVVEPSAATLLSFGCGAVRTFATPTRECDDGLGRWLKELFEINHLVPEHLFLIGSRGDVELTSVRLSEALDMSIVTSNEAQLILARGTALMVRSNAVTVAVPVSVEQRTALKQSAVIALGQKMVWISPPVRAATALVAGVIALFVVGPMLLSQSESPSTQDQPASNSSHTSVSIQAVPATPVPPPVKKVNQRMVQPAPAPLPPSAPTPPVVQASAPEATVAVEVSAREAHLPTPAEVPHLPAETSHLPAEGTPHLSGAAPILAAEVPTVEAAAEPTTPMQAASSPLWSALP